LDNIGGGQALDLLAQFAEKAKSPAVRSKAIEWMVKDERPKDILLIRKISLDDPDAGVRETAAKALKKK
jgi:HEAT repeat protein